MVLKNISLEVGIPKDVDVKVEGSVVTIRGAHGIIKRDFYHPKILITKDKEVIKIEGKMLNSKERIIVSTFRALIRNNLNGVIKPYAYELKICSGHFPIKAGVEGEKFVIKNLFGEKTPRVVEIPKNVKVIVNGNVVKVESVDREAGGQAAALIERNTIRPGFDKRIFQDGIYIVRKGGEDE